MIFTIKLERQTGRLPNLRRAALPSRRGARKWWGEHTQRLRLPLHLRHIGLKSLEDPEHFRA
jgi:hypothetical protein